MIGDELNKQVTGFKDQETKELFLSMCNSSLRQMVDWDKFRENDKEGLFKGFTNSRLCMKWRYLTLRNKGLCHYCGLSKATESNGMCRSCLTKVRKK